MSRTFFTGYFLSFLTSILMSVLKLEFVSYSYHWQMISFVISWKYFPWTYIGLLKNMRNIIFILQVCYEKYFPDSLMSNQSMCTWYAVDYLVWYISYFQLKIVGIFSIFQDVEDITEWIQITLVLIILSTWNILVWNLFAIWYTVLFVRIQLSHTSWWLNDHSPSIYYLLIERRLRCGPCLEDRRWNNIDDHSPLRIIKRMK